MVSAHVFASKQGGRAGGRAGGGRGGRGHNVAIGLQRLSAAPQRALLPAADGIDLDARPADVDRLYSHGLYSYGPYKLWPMQLWPV